jgi:hypothetical protein
MAHTLDLQRETHLMKNKKISADTILKTGRLLLRHPPLDDAAPIFSVVSSAQFPEQLPLKDINNVGESLL